MKPIVPALLIALTMFSVGACSSPLPVASAPAAADPHQAGVVAAAATSTPSAAPEAGSSCGLVTTADASKAAGRAMTISADGGATGVCVFASTSDASFVLYVQVHSGSEDISSLKQQLEGLSEHVSGLGDDAFWNATLGEVFVQKGDRAFTVGLPTFSNLTSTPAAVEAKMVALATAALSRF